nr:PREDICTED: receptor-like protein kinase HSL1 [Daucus carota subsp. sativus]
MASTFLLLVLLLVSFAPRLSFSLNQEAACLHEIKLFHFDDPDNVLSDWILKENDTRCHWFGITCDRLTLSVNSINLSNAHIAGAFPSSLLCLGLPNLNFVILANNSINSTLSDDISTCRSLQYLDLSQNLLTGKLPATLPNIPHIIHIDFSGNSFFGDVPASFGMFRTIETIFLSQNFLDGAIPEFLGNISSLKQLDLSMNQLLPSRIPPGLGKSLSACSVHVQCMFCACYVQQGLDGSIKELSVFDPSKNKLFGTILEELCSLPLMSLDLKLPEQLGKNSPLVWLDVTNNQFFGKVPKSLCDNGVLDSILVKHNNFTGDILVRLAKCRSLTHVVLDYNNFFGQVPTEFQGTPKLC